MSTNNNKTFALLFLGGMVLGASGYIGYRLYKKTKKEEEEIITAEQIRAEVEAMKIAGVLKPEDPFLEEVFEFDEEDSSENAEELYLQFNESLGQPVKDPSKKIEILMSSADFRPDPDSIYNLLEKKIRVGDQEEQNEKKAGGEILRANLDPNSTDALLQYRDMLLSEFSAEEEYEDVYSTMKRLFATPYTPSTITTFDQDMVDSLRYDRAEFFGEDSVWSKGEVSMMEVILYLATHVDHNIDGGVPNYCEDWLGKTGISWSTGAATYDQIMQDLMYHRFVNDNGYGIFSLNEEQMGSVALRSGGEGSISFSTQMDEYIEYMMELIGDDDYEEFNIEEF